jgi:hypothetical protein
MSWAGIAAAVAAGVALGGSGVRGAGLMHYGDRGVSFDYPAGWSYVQEGTAAFTLHYQPIVFVSTQPLRDPCTANACESALASPLQPGGIFLEWEWAYRAPRVHWRPNTTIAGRPALVQIDRSGPVEVVSALFTRRGLAMTATLRAPGLRLHERQVRAMLASLRFDR